MTTLHTANNNLEVAKYLLREEEDGYLMFVGEQEKNYILNPTAATILQCLSSGESLEQICGTLKRHYQLDGEVDIELQLQEFLSRLEELGLVRKNGHISKGLPVQYASPSILDLEEIDKKGAQCRMFGMP